MQLIYQLLRLRFFCEDTTYPIDCYRSGYAIIRSSGGVRQVVSLFGFWRLQRGRLLGPGVSQNCRFMVSGLLAA